MALQGNLPLPQGKSLQKRVEANISSKSGHLEDQSLDLDARTMALLGKRQQLRVSSWDPGIAKEELTLCLIRGILVWSRWWLFRRH